MEEGDGGINSGAGLGVSDCLFDEGSDEDETDWGGDGGRGDGGGGGVLCVLVNEDGCGGCGVKSGRSAGLLVNCGMMGDFSDSG